jgi:hypothetical protein
MQGMKARTTQKSPEQAAAHIAYNKVGRERQSTLASKSKNYYDSLTTSKRQR